MNRFIASHAMGEIYVDPLDMLWYMSDSSYFDKKKDFSLFRFLLDLASLTFRYNASINNENIWNRTLIRDLNDIIIQMAFSFEKIVGLSDDLVCTGDIVTAEDCVKSFEQFINNEPFDFFDFGEIKEIMDLIDIELKTFKKLLQDFIIHCRYFIKNGRKHKDIIYIEIIKDFKYHLKKLVSKKIFTLKKFFYS